MKRREFITLAWRRGGGIVAALQRGRSRVSACGVSAF